jgi:hypothetical protein
MRNRILARRGLSRVELVTLATLAVVCSGLVTVVVYKSVESGRQSTCQDRLRQLSLALFKYANKTTTNELPGYINALEREDRFAYHDPRSGRTEPVSWVVMILPELDQKEIYQEWLGGDSPGDGKRIGSPAVERTHRYLEYLICPSDPPPNTTGTPLAYAVNTGIPDFPGSAGIDLPRHPVRTDCLCEACGNQGDTGNFIANRDFPANGMFFDNFTDSKHFDRAAKSRPFAMTPAGVSDPKDKTILLAENVDAFDYTFSTAAGDEAYVTAERRIGIVWAPTTTFEPGRSQNSRQIGKLPTAIPPRTSYLANFPPPPPIEDWPKGKPPRDSYRINIETGKGDGLSYDHSRPSSKHPGGVNMAFASNHVNFVKQTLSYYVYVLLMTSNDAHTGTFDAQGNRILLPEYVRKSDFNLY